MTVLLLASFDASKCVFWLFAYLLQHPPWMERVQAEVFAFLNNHSCTAQNDPSSFAASLSSVPLSMWEVSTHFPALELCLQETLRLVVNGALLRRNVSSNVTVRGHTIRHGEYTVLMTENLHFDSNIYEEPYRFLPDRNQSIATARESFVGWGRGTSG